MSIKNSRAMMLQIENNNERVQLVVDPFKEGLYCDKGDIFKKN